MFYAAAQNMLNQHSNQSSMSTLKRSLFQLALVPPNNPREQLNQSLSNNSDRAKQNISLPEKQHFQQDRDRSLSYKLNNSIEHNTSLERLQNAYNIKGNFQIANENPSLLVEKKLKIRVFVKSLYRLKEYLLKQIQENNYNPNKNKSGLKLKILKLKSQLKDNQKKLELDKGLNLKSLNNHKSKKNLELPRKSQIPPKLSVSPQKDGLFMQIYKSKLTNNNQQNDILQKLNNIQNNINNLQQSTMKQNEVSSVRNNIKQMIRKSSQLLPQHNDQIQEEPQQQSNDRQLECETIFIPANQKINTDVDTSQYQPQSKEISQSTHNFIQNNSFQVHQQNNMSTISNPINNSQHYSSQNQNINSIINHSRLTISQLTQRERSISNEKQNEELLAKVDEIKDEIKGLQQKVKTCTNQSITKITTQNSYVNVNIIKNQIQVQKQEEPKSSQRN